MLRILFILAWGVGVVIWAWETCDGPFRQCVGSISASLSKDATEVLSALPSPDLVDDKPEPLQAAPAAPGSGETLKTTTRWDGAMTPELAAKIDKALDNDTGFNAKPPVVRIPLSPPDPSRAANADTALPATTPAEEPHFPDTDLKDVARLLMQVEASDGGVVQPKSRANRTQRPETDTESLKKQLQTLLGDSL